MYKVIFFHFGRTEHWGEIQKKSRENYRRADVVNLNFEICSWTISGR